MIHDKYMRFGPFLKSMVVLCLCGLTLRIYVSPEGNAELGFPDHRAALDHAAAELGFDQALYYGNFALATIAVLYFGVGLFLVARKHLSGFLFLEDVGYCALAVALPFFHFGYAMAHTSANRIWLLAGSWFLTSFLWMLSIAARELQKRKY